jgi:HlyD family secretion protein
MKKKWILIIGAGVVLVVFIVIALKSNQVKKTKATVEIARKGKITSIVTATGKVKAQADVEISADVMGRIEELPVKEGQRVKTGHLLVKIDDRSRQMDVAQAKGSLLSAQSAYEKARIELNREKQLFEKQLTSQSSLDIIQNLYDQAHAQVQIYQATHDRAQDQLNKCTIRSPMNGIVTKLNSEKGENVVIGTMNNPGTVIMVVSDLSAIEIEAEVDETDIASVAVGQDVEILLDAFPDTTFKGQVIQVGNSAKASSFGISDQVTNFLVKILILDSVENIKPGMTASVDITTDYREDAIRIPAGAVVMRPEDTGQEKEEDGSKEGGEADSSDEFVRTEIKEIDGVFVCNEGKAKFAPVNTGIRDQQYVEITSGLSEGDSVVTGSYRTLRSLKHDEVIDPQKPKFGPDVEQGEGSES